MSKAGNFDPGEAQTTYSTQQFDHQSRLPIVQGSRLHSCLDLWSSCDSVSAYVFVKLSGQRGNDDTARLILSSDNAGRSQIKEKGLGVFAAKAGLEIGT